MAVTAFTIIVTDERGRPLSNVPVQAVDVSDRSVASTVTSDKNGKVAFSGLTSAEYQAIALVDRHYHLQWVE